MNTINLQLREKREEKQLTMRDVSAMTGIDPAIISKMESGERLPTEKQMAALAYLYQLDQSNLQIQWLAERIIRLVDGEATAIEALELAKAQLSKKDTQVKVKIPDISPELKEKLAKADFMKGLMEKKQPLEPPQLEKMKKEFTQEYIFETNRMWGSPFSLQDTESILQKGMTIPGKSLRQHLEVINHLDAVAYLRDLATSKDKLNVPVFLGLHRLFMHSIDRDQAGEFRTTPLENTISKVALPKPKDLEKELDELFAYYQQNKDSLHPILLAAELHQRFLQIQPFKEGNGLISSILLNFELLRKGYTLTFIKGDSVARQNYLHALEQIQSGQNQELFYGLVADAIGDSLRNHLEWRPLWF